VCEALVGGVEEAQRMRPYCSQLVADYITHVVMAVPPATVNYAAAVTDTSELVQQPGQGGILPPGAAAKLRQGVLLLLGALGPGDLQALHVALGPGWGGARRGVLAALRKEWERSVRYTGKV
jgi:hypothetical protein